MNLELNKQISVWRGNSTPPTDYHLWIKENGDILINISDNWDVVATTSNLESLSTLLEKVENLKIQEVETDNSSTFKSYSLVYDGLSKGTIDIPKDRFLKNVLYDLSSKKLIFTFITSDGTDSTQEISVSDLVDVYKAGNNVSISEDNTISVDLSKYLTTSDYTEGKKNITITDKINLTTETALSLATKYTKVANNSFNFYIVADSSNTLPSSETRININSSITDLVGAEGANVGDIFVIGKLNLLPVYKIIPLNDAKAENSSYKGTQGVVTPWDKAQINKVPNMESAISAAKNNLPTYSESNMNNALKTGFYPWCTLGRPSGSTGAYTLVTLASTTADSSGYTTIEQTAYGRQNDELGKIYKRIIFKPSSGDTEYGEWKEVSNDSIIADSIDVPFIPNGLAATLNISRTNYSYGVPCTDIIFGINMWNTRSYKEDERNAFYPYSGISFTEDGIGMYAPLNYLNEDSGNGFVKCQLHGNYHTPTAELGFYTLDNLEELQNGYGANCDEPYIVSGFSKYFFNFNKAEELGVFRTDSSSGKTIIDTIQEDLDNKADKTELSNYLPLTGGTISNSLNVTGTLTTGGKSVLTSHLPIYKLTLLKNGSNVGTFTPTNADSTLNISVPTKLSELTDDIVSGKYLPLAGGTITNNLIINGKITLGGNNVLDISTTNISDLTIKINNVSRTIPTKLSQLTNDIVEACTTNEINALFE